MTVKIGNKEVQLTDYLSSNQIQKALYETYEQGYQDGGSDMEQAKQIIIDELLKQIEQIRADVIEECCKQISERVNYWDNCANAVDKGSNEYKIFISLAKNFKELLEQLKEQNR